MPRHLLIGLILLATLGLSAYVLIQDDSASSIQTSVAVADAMGSDTTGYRRAETMRDFTFPDDHGPHDGFKTEWWYYTGNLAGQNGRRFGYEFTIFRIALAPPDSARPVLAANASAPQVDAVTNDTTASDWSTDHMYMAHFAVSDIANEQFYDYERFAREAAGLAGASGDPFRVYLGDWSVQGAPGDSTSDTTFPMRIQADAGEVAIDLTLDPAKPYILQGDRGLSQKGDGKGNASYYYSYTRLNTTGTVAVGADTAQVEGLSWMDREWSTSALGDDQVGWDWFALQLSDERDLMYYQIRQSDGSPSRFTEGVLVGPNGEKTTITRGDVELTVLDRWTNEQGATYPVKWRLRVPEENLDLTVTAFFEDQELDVSVRYWEGAVRIEGTSNGEPVKGTGYVEMTGYGDNEAQRVS